MKKTLIALTACVTLLLAGHTTTAQANPTSATTTTTTSQAAATSYWRVPYNGDIYAVTPTAIKKLTLTQYVAAGRPAIKTAAASYVKYPWDAQIHAVTFFGASRSMWAWKHLNAQEWTNAGRPTPRIAGWIQSTAYTKTSTSNTIYAQLPGGVKHALTYAQWVAAGSPAPRLVGPPSAYVKYAWDSQIFRVTFNGTARSTWTWKKLTFADWVAAGQPKPRNAGWIQGTVYTKTSAAYTIFAQLPGGVKHALTYAEWVAAGSPTPRLINLGPSIFSVDYDTEIRRGQFVPYEIQGKWCTRIPTPETGKIECVNLAAQVANDQLSLTEFQRSTWEDGDDLAPWRFRACRVYSGDPVCSEETHAIYHYFKPGLPWKCSDVFSSSTCVTDYSRYHNIPEARLVNRTKARPKFWTIFDSVPMYRVQ